MVGVDNLRTLLQPHGIYSYLHGLGGVLHERQAVFVNAEELGYPFAHYIDGGRKVGSVELLRAALDRFERSPLSVQNRHRYSTERPVVKVNHVRVQQPQVRAKPLLTGGNEGGAFGDQRHCTNSTACTN